VYRQIRSKELVVPWGRYYAFDVSWKGQTYKVCYGFVKDSDSRDGLDLLQAFESGALADMFWTDEHGDRWCLGETSEPPAAPPAAESHMVVEMSLRLQNLENDFRALRQENEELKLKLENDLRALRQENDELKLKFTELATHAIQQRSVVTGILTVLQSQQRPLFPFPPLVQPLQ
jgi:hypothetical protein